MKTIATEKMCIYDENQKSTLRIDFLCQNEVKPFFAVSQKKSDLSS